LGISTYFSLISREYLFGVLPWLCLKGKLYLAEVFIVLIIEGKPILFTPKIFS